MAKVVAAANADAYGDLPRPKGGGQAIEYTPGASGGGGGHSRTNHAAGMRARAPAVVVAITSSTEHRAIAAKRTMNAPCAFARTYARRLIPAPTTRIRTRACGAKPAPAIPRLCPGATRIAGAAVAAVAVGAATMAHTRINRTSGRITREY